MYPIYTEATVIFLFSISFQMKCGAGKEMPNWRASKEIHFPSFFILYYLYFAVEFEVEWREIPISKKVKSIPDYQN